MQLKLYEEITAWSVRGLIESLQAAPGVDVTLRINSPGGDVTEGFALANALKSHDGKTVAVVEGVCASAATFAACACSEVQMHQESLLMVHGAWGWKDGDANEMESFAEVLRKMTDLAVGLYMRKTGRDEATVRAWLEKDTWMTPQEAKDAGLCDVILTDAAPPSAKTITARYLARLKPVAPARAQERTVTDQEVLEKLRAYGLPEKPEKEDVDRALAAYMDQTDDEPAMRRVMREHCEKMGDLTITHDDEDEDDEDDKEKDGGGAKSKRELAAQVSLLQKRLGEQSSTIASLDQRLKDADVATKNQRIADQFVRDAAAYLDETEAREQIAVYNYDAARALAFARKLPERKPRVSGFGPWTQGGGIPGNGGANMSSHGGEKAVRVGGRTAVLHGFAASAAAKKRAAEQKIEYSEALRQVAKENPSLIKGA